MQERVPPLFTAAIISGPALPNEEPTRTFRTSLNTLGDGFVEAIANGTLVSIANKQKGITGNEVHGLVIKVPVLEANNRKRIGRFGWKNQHASLLSFSGDAYLNEIGITNFLVRKENTSLGRFVGFGTIFDIVPDVPSILTGNRCQPINGGDFPIPEALARKIIHPFGDFLLHDIGTGDGIVQNGGQITRLTVRTAPLWGLRTRTNLMHDGTSFTFREAILRHGVEAAAVRARFQSLSPLQKQQLFTFLETL